MHADLIHDPETQRLWSVAHDAKIDVYWANQHAWNERMMNQMEALGARLQKVENRLVWLAGLATGMAMLSTTIAVMLGIRDLLGGG